MRRLSLSALATLALLAAMTLLPATAHAQQIFVSTLGSDTTGDGTALAPFRTVGQAVDYAYDGDEVVVGTGTFEENIVTGTQLSFTGQGADQTTISAAAASPVITLVSLGAGETIRGFSIVGGTGADETLPTQGGGIYLLNSSPTIADCTFAENTADQGGALYAEYCSDGLKLDGCTFIDNSATLRGGALYAVSESPITVTDCTFVQNHADEAGGATFVNADSPLTIGGCSFDRNSTDDFGGALAVFPGASVVVTSSVFTTNTAALSGGAIASNEGSVTLEECTVAGGSAERGGGIFAGSGSTLICNGSTLAGNSASLDGGAIFVNVSTMECAESTLAGNSADHWGGGVAIYYADGTITRSTITGSSAPMGGGVLAWGGTVTVTSSCIVKNTIDGPSMLGAAFNVYEGAASINGCTIADNSSGVVGSNDTDCVIKNSILWNGEMNTVGFAVTACDVIGGAPGAGNINADPKFLSAATGDYNLTAASPCIGAADFDSSPRLDITGLPRPQGRLPDMGAYEFDYVAPIGPSDPILLSGTHPVDTWVTERSGSVALVDLLGDVDPAGYAITMTEDSPGVIPHVMTLPFPGSSYEFTVPEDGIWYVNVATVDVYGRWSGGTSYGPIKIDADAPAFAHDAPTAWQTDDVTVALHVRDTVSGVAGLDSSGDGTYVRSLGGRDAEWSFSEEGVNSRRFSSVDNAGNLSDTTVEVRIDKSDPSSEATSRPGWCAASDEVTITAEDAYSGVAATWYSIDDGTTTRYREPFKLTRSGETTVTYWSEDVAGNAESPKHLRILADVDPPNTTAHVPSGAEGSIEITFTATDEHSGVAETRWSLDGGPEQTTPAVTTSALGSHRLRYWSVDVAGNTEQPSEVTFQVLSRTPNVPSAVGYTLCPGGSRVSWSDAANATGYQVLVDGLLAATTPADVHNVTIPKPLGPASDVRVRSVGADGKATQPVRGAYAASGWLHLGTVRFAAGSSTLSTLARYRLRVYAASIVRLGFHEVYVPGFTSTRAPETSSVRQRLSARRAKAVGDYLAGEFHKREAPVYIRTAGRGAASPVASNATAAGAAQNQRAEIYSR